MQRILVIFILLSSLLYNQDKLIPSYYEIDKNLSNELSKIIVDLELDKDFDVADDGIEQVSLAVIDLMGSNPRLSGVNLDNFIY